MKKRLSFYFIVLYIIGIILIPNGVDTLFGGIPFRLLLSYILIAIFIYERIIIKPQIRNINKLLIFFPLLFLVITCISLINAVSPITCIYTLLKFLSYFVIAYFLLTEKYTKDEYSIFVKVLLGCGTIVLLYGIITYLFNINLDPKGVYRYNGAKGRVFSTFENSNYYGIFCTLFLSFCLYLFMECQTKRQYMFYLIIILCLINICLTFSRSIYFIFALIIFSIIIFSINNIKKYLKKIINLFIMCLLLLFIPGVLSIISVTAKEFLPKNWFKESVKNKTSYENIDSYKVVSNSDEDKEDMIILVDGDYVSVHKEVVYDKNEEGNVVEKEIFVTTTDDASAITRKEFTAIVKKVINDNSYFGVGFGNYKQFLSQEQNSEKYITGKFGFPHNFFNHLYAETGIFSLICFVIILLLCYVSIIIKYIRTSNKIFLYSFTMLICITIMCFFESVFYDSQLVPAYILISSFLMVSFDNSSRPNEKKTMFISSVGGHLTQMLSLEKLIRKFNYILVTEKTPVTISLKKKYEIEYLKYGSRKKIINYIYISFCNCCKSLFLIIKYNPKVIISTGTHTAVPMFILGKICGKKLIYIESFAKSKSPTLTGKMLYPLSTTFIVQWKEMLKFYPKAKYYGGIY